MYWGDMYLTATAFAVAPEVAVEWAVNQGLYPAALAEKTQQIAVAVAHREHRAVDFALAAARDAFDAAPQTPADVGMIAYADVLHAGRDVWNVAQHAQFHLGLPQCRPYEVRAGCAGALVALDQACEYLRVRADDPQAPTAALILAADVYHLPAIDRWTTDPELPWADGGAALLVSRERAGAFARILSIHTHTEPSAVAMQEGTGPFGPHNPQHPIDLKARAKHFFATVTPNTEMRLRHAAGIRATVEGALSQAAVTRDDVSYIVTQFHGLDALTRHYLPPLGFDLDQTTWDLGGRRIGHLGAADPPAALHLLRLSGKAQPGQTIAMFSEGIGQLWTCVVLELLDGAALPP